MGGVEGTDAAVALVTRQGEATAYVCGGPSSYEALSRWFPVRLEAGLLSGDRDGWALRGAVASGVLTGELFEPGGASHPFRAELARDGTVAGLYEANDDGCRTGAIVLQAGPAEAPRVQGTWCSRDGLKAQVTPARPAALRGQGFDLEVQAGAALRRLHVSPVFGE